MPTQPTKTNHSYNLRDFYSFYRQHRKAQGLPFCDYKVYKAAIEKMFQHLNKKIIEGRIFNMPHRLGSLFVATRKGRHPTTYKNTDGIPLSPRQMYPLGYQKIAQFRWSKPYRFKNSNLYLFRPFVTSNEFKEEYGKKGLLNHLIDISNDPTKPAYRQI